MSKAIASAGRIPPLHGGVDRDLYGIGFIFNGLAVRKHNIDCPGVCQGAQLLDYELETALFSALSNTCIDDPPFFNKLIEARGISV